MGTDTSLVHVLCEDDRSRFMDRIKVSESGCWEWSMGLTTTGYGVFHVGRHRTPRFLWAHRASWMLFRGEIPEDRPCILHVCDNRKCVNPDHLFCGTKRENTLDMVSKGRHGNSGLRVEEVLMIYQSHLPVCELVGILDITANTIRLIKAGHSWSSVTGSVR